MQLNLLTIVLSLQPHKVQVSKGVKNVDPTDCAQNLTKWPYCGPASHLHAQPKLGSSPFIIDYGTEVTSWLHVMVC